MSDLLTIAEQDTDVSAPPLPEIVPIAPLLQADVQRAVEERELPSVVPPPPKRVEGGCYLVSYTPLPASGAQPLPFDGSLRVEEPKPNEYIMSGDLYQRLTLWSPTGPVMVPPPDPAAGIPILPHKQHRYYLRVTRVAPQPLGPLQGQGGITFDFEMRRFDSTARQWRLVETCTVEMKWARVPAGYPFPSCYLTGDVKNSAGALLGAMTMGKVSHNLRKATIEIDCVTGCHPPLDNGEGKTWSTVFAQANWAITVVPSNPFVKKTGSRSGDSWSTAECQAVMLDWRESANIENEWRYYLLCVKQLDTPEPKTPGVMFDDGVANTNNIPREGAAVAAESLFPDESLWGVCRNGPLSHPICAKAYFHTAVHEIGHAMSLRPAESYTGEEPAGSYPGGYMMEELRTIAGNSSWQNPFPKNILCEFSDADLRQLRHWSDALVRPGGYVV